MQGGDHCRGGVENARRFTSWLDTGGRVGIDAGEAGGFGWEDWHDQAVASDGGAVNPWFVFGDGEIINKISCFEVVGAIEDQVDV